MPIIPVRIVTLPSLIEPARLARQISILPECHLKPLSGNVNMR
jgi:hypothetical protein